MNPRYYLPEIVMTILGLAFFAESSPRKGCLASQSGFAWLDSRPAGLLDARFAKLPLGFEVNAGQASLEYELLAHGAGYDVYLSPRGVALALYRQDRNPEGAITMSLEGGNPEARWEPVDARAGRMNYYLGNDPARWITNIPTYSRVRYRAVYPGIDVDYYGSQQQLEHDFIVAPGADPVRIRMRFEGAASHVAADGSLAVERAAGATPARWLKPVVYQTGAKGERQEIESGYRILADGSIGFELGSYDRTRALIIDPVVTYSTYLGRNGNDGLLGIAVDGSGNTYVTGSTDSQEFATTPGAPVNPRAGTQDAVVAKYNAAGTALVYAARIGGIGADLGLGIAVDSAGNAYVTGSAESADFPVTSGALQTRYGGRGQGESAAGDCFLLKLNSSGAGLTYSTYLGGSASETCRGVATDSAGNAFVAGHSSSTNFPVTENAFQRTFRGGGEQFYLQPSDAFVAKINPAGSALVYSTYLGGNLDDAAQAIAVDASGNVFVAGYTGSPNFPVTPNAAQRNFGGEGGQRYVTFGDAFIAKLNPAGSTLTYSTFLGGRSEDAAFGLAIDGQGNAYVTGATLSPAFPATASAVQRTLQGTGGSADFTTGDAFAAKLNPAGTEFVYATYLGGARDDLGWAIAVDPSGAAVVGGYSMSQNFPVSTDARQTAYRGESLGNIIPTGDAFVVRLSPTGSAITYSTYLGGLGDDSVLALALDSASNVYIAGATESPDFPATGGTPQTGYGGGISGPRFPVGDGFVAKLSDFGGGGSPASGISISALVSAASYAGGGGAPGEIVVLTGVSIGPTNLATLALTPTNTVAAMVSDTRILFDNVPAPLLYVSGGQSSAVVPYEMAGRASANVVVEYRGGRSAALSVPILASKPALFSANASGRGPGAIQNEDFSLNTAANPSSKGRVVILYGTGEGQTNPPGVTGSLAITQFPKPVLAVSVTIGGRTADVLYAGAGPSQIAGLFQINAKVPEDVASGNQDVIVTVGSARSQAGLTVAVR